MPRQPRLLLDDLPLHIVQRGHNREPCFRTPRDYSSYLRWLDEALRQAECLLHAYVLMTNHVHLLLTPRRAATVPGLIMSVGRRYVRYFNRMYARTGTLWDSRYKSSLVESDAYLLACHRYIELNPVRAGLVVSPDDYRWSSHCANALGTPDAILKPHALYLSLGDSAEDRRSAYRKLFDSAPDARTVDDIRAALKRSQPLGGRGFHVRLEQVTGVSRAVRPRGRPRRQDGAENVGRGGERVFCATGSAINQP